MTISGLGRGLRSFWILRSVDWYFVYSRFGTTCGPMFKGKTVQEELILQDRTTGFPETSVTKYQYIHLGHMPRRGRYFLIHFIVPFRTCCLM